MKQRLSRPKLTAQETRLIQQLRQQPEMSVRVQGILDLAHAAEGPLKTADEIEALLIQELRQLGGTTMNQWATQAEARVSAELQAQDATVRGLKKNADVVVCLWRGDGERAALAQPEPELPPSLARAAGSDTPRPLAAAGACADGLRL
jgi:hypothetical protein